MPSAVGFHPDSGLKLTASDHMAAGAISSAMTRAALQPLDVLKIRMQLQVETKAEAKFPSVPSAVVRMFRDSYVTFSVSP